MISVIIPTHNDAERLAHSLSALVHAAVEGLVGEVIVSDSGSTDGTLGAADQAGCHMVRSDDPGEAIGQARKDWLLFLEPGARPVGDWMDPVATHISVSQSPARFSRAPEARLPFLARLFHRPRALEHGLLITGRQAKALIRPARSIEQMTTGVASRRLTALLVPARP